MSPEEIERLRSYTDKLVQVDTVDGEHMIVRIFMLQDEYQDFIYNVVSTNKEESYRVSIKSCAFLMPYTDVVAFSLVQEEG